MRVTLHCIVRLQVVFAVCCLLGRCPLPDFPWSRSLVASQSPTIFFVAVYIPETLLNSGGLSHLDLNQMHFPTDFLWTSFILTS